MEVRLVSNRPIGWATALAVLLWVGSAAATEPKPPVEPTEDAPASEEPEPAGPWAYTLDPAKSWLYVLVFNDDTRWTPVVGHNHGIKATTFDGSVTWDPDDPSVCDVQISFPVTALEVDPPGMRERAGLTAEGAIGDGAKRTVIGNMLGKSQLDAKSFPEIRYRSTRCEATPDGARVTGTLSVRGVSKEVTVPMKVTADPDSFRARGSFTLGHADFSMKPFTYGPATPKNQEKLEFHVDVVGSRTGA